MPPLFSWPKLMIGANAAFHYVLMRDRSIPLIVNASGRFTSELLRTRIDQYYPGGLQNGSYIETWNLPGGKTRERRTPAEEILSLSRTDNKLGKASTMSLIDNSRSIASFCLSPYIIWIGGSRTTLFTYR